MVYCGLAADQPYYDHMRDERPPELPPRLEMDEPPTLIPPVRPTPIEPEVIEPEVRAAGPGGPPIHPLSAVLLVAVDNLWNLADWAVIDWIITIPLSFITVLVPVFGIQKSFRRDSTWRALTLACLLAVLAAVPTSITGTPAGLAILTWAGLTKFFGRKPPRADG